MSDISLNPDLPILPAETAKAAPAGPNWLDQDPVLREMWMQNKTPQMIAEALNRSVPAIMTRAARLGLPRRSAPGRKPGRKLDENGAVIVAPPRRSSTRSSSMVSTDNAPPQTSLRICLMCLTRFESAGRHNRICSTCKGTADYTTASALPDIHLPSG